MPRLADILVAGTPAYVERFGERLLPSHRHVLGAVCACRTSAMGGHLMQCDNPECRDQVFRYHSCGNRHCPRCHRGRTARWTEAWTAKLLPVPYYLLTFTLPAELHSLARSNQRTVYAAIMTASARAVQELAVDPKWVGAKLGLLSVLHTWTRSIAYHPHIHILATAGGLAVDDDGNQVWCDPKNPRFLMPAYILSKIFRRELRDILGKAEILDTIDERIWTKKWVVHCQSAGDGSRVLRYMARYLDRIAISDSRIVSFIETDDPAASTVTIRWTDRQKASEQSMTLSLLDFMARYLQHVLPPHLPKVRAYGLFASSNRPRLETARQILADLDPVIPDDSPRVEVEPRHDRCCQVCKTGSYRVVSDVGQLTPLAPRATPKNVPSGSSRAPP